MKKSILYLLVVAAAFAQVVRPALATNTEGLRPVAGPSSADRHGNLIAVDAPSIVTSASHEIASVMAADVADEPTAGLDARNEGRGPIRIVQNDPAAPSTCPRGVNHDDGCQGAQPSGSVQHADYFTSYTGVHYPVRPKWNVAGVDYPVGHSGDLKDPSVRGNLPACAKYSSNEVIIDTDVQPCVLDRLDFALHGGTCLKIRGTGGKTVTFSNDRFFPNVSVCPYYVMIVERGEAANVIIRYSDFSDDRVTPIIGDIFWIGSGKATLQYNNFERIACRIVNTGEGSKASVTLEYNYLESIGSTGECHGETVEYNSAETVDRHIESFNNYYQPADGCWLGKSCVTSFAYIQSAAPGPKGPGNLSVAEVNNNVMISRPTTKNAVAMGGLIWFDTTFNNTIGSATVKNNYVDPAGSYFAILVHAGGQYAGSIGASNCSGNVLYSANGASPIIGQLGNGGSIMNCK